MYKMGIKILAKLIQRSTACRCLTDLEFTEVENEVGGVSSTEEG